MDPLDSWVKYKRDQQKKQQKKRETWAKEVKVLESTNLTQEMCNDVFQKLGWKSLYRIQERFWTLEMCREAIKRETDIRFLYDYIPEELRKDPVIVAGLTCKACGLADIEVVRRCNGCWKVVCKQEWNACAFCNDDEEFVYCDDCPRTTTVRVCDKKH